MGEGNIERANRKGLRRRLGFALVAGALALVGVPSTASAATLTPNVLTDENTSNSNCSLREAVTAAQTDGDHNGCLADGTGVDADADIIVLTSGSTYTLGGTGLNGQDDLNAVGDLDVIGQSGDQTLTIQTSGAGRATIDANGAVSGDRAIELRGSVLANLLASVTLTNLNITGGVESAGGGGGGINIGSWTLGIAISNSRIFSNSSAAGLGGGIRDSGGGGITGTITNTTIDSNTAASGGGIWAEGGDRSISGSTINGNHATTLSGGGIGYNTVGITLTNSTVSGNEAATDGGGIAMGNNTPSLVLKNATIASNTADQDNSGDPGEGGGVWLATGAGGAINSQNSILADNADLSGGAPDCFASSGFTSDGHNLIESTTGCAFTNNNDITGMEPVLGSLALNGQPAGSPMTHALLTGSPAINAGDPGTPDGTGTHCEATDQRGVTRVGSVQPCDIGAYEVQDADGDGVVDTADNCPTGAAAGTDTDGDGCKDAGEDADDDNDSVPDTTETGCPGGGIATNPDSDGDGTQDDPDAFPCDNTETTDTDGDGVGNNADNCDNDANPTQANFDGDAQGNACDVDDDNDGVADTSDGCPFQANATANGCPAPPPVVTTPTETGQRAAALKKCKKKKTAAKRKKCRKKARLLPL